MTFIHLIGKNVVRQRIRTTLTIAGIALAIASIVIFGLITSGLADTVSGMMKPGEADFTVAKAGSSDLMLSLLTQQQVERITAIEGIKESVPFVMAIVPTPGNPYFIVGGINAQKIGFLKARIIEGRMYEEGRDEMVIGKATATNKNIKVGDLFTIQNKQMQVVGIYESGDSLQDSSAATSITIAQELSNIDDKVSMVFVVVKDGYQVEEVAQHLEQQNSDLITLVNLEDFNKVDQGVIIINSATEAISLLAIIIGTFGVMNTIIMSVMERTREIGVLRAVGWSKARVIGMILGESLIIGVSAALVGILLGVISIELVKATELGKTFLRPVYTVDSFVEAVMVAIVVVLCGSIYPAYRASKMQPTEALRYE